MRRILPLSSPCPPATVDANSAFSALHDGAGVDARRRIERGQRVAVAPRRDQGHAERARRRPRARGEGAPRWPPARPRRPAPSRSRGRRASATMLRDRGGEGRLAGRPGSSARAGGRSRSAATSRLSMRSQARALTERKASPGGRASAFWLPTTTTSTPQAAVSSGMAPAPEIASTTRSVPGRPRVIRASASTSWRGAGGGLVELDEDRPGSSGSASRARATSSGGDRLAPRRLRGPATSMP